MRSSFLAIRVLASIVHGNGQGLIGGIDDVDAASFQLFRIFGLEQHVPAIERHITQRGLDLVYVITKARRAPHIVDGILVAGIIFGEPLHDLWPHVGKVRQLGFIELLENARGNLASKERACRNHHIIAGSASEQLGFNDLVIIKDVVDNLDTGLLRELRQERFVNVIRPVYRRSPRAPARGPMLKMLPWRERQCRKWSFSILASCSLFLSRSAASGSKINRVLTLERRHASAL